MQAIINARAHMDEHTLHVAKRSRLCSTKVGQRRMFRPMSRFRAWLVATMVCVAIHARAGESSTDFVLPSGDVVAGVRLAEIESMAQQSARVRDAVRTTFGVDIGQVPIHVLKMDDVKALYREIGARMPGNMRLLGWELDGHVFIHRELGGVSDEVLIHECLHAITRRTFADGAHARGVSNVIEGITQYLTLQALAARPNAAAFSRTQKHVYVAFTRFAEVLATLVGETNLRTAYFKTGFDALAARVAAVTHDKKRLVEASRLIDEKNEQGALDRLTRGL
jgi:hypothetical protein